MNYQKHYNLLIETRNSLYSSRKEQKAGGSYFERHHIQPLSMGGSHEKDNLVLLTAREHYLVHWLLWKIHRNKQMAWAFYSLSMDRYKKRRLTAKQYETCRKLHNIANRGKFSSRGFLGKTHSRQAREIMRKTKLGANNPMYGLGEKHPNHKRQGTNNPNYGREPWLNAGVLHNPKQAFLWKQREELFKLWCARQKPHWYAFGKELKLTDPTGQQYTPHSFKGMVQWFERNMQ
ncbi:MAG: HNH endonuclease [Candidatus Thorarchaeota archaeon]|nr:MAG: HNH endonuclease [Candidatus Thorarchaeota archaeon]